MPTDETSTGADVEGCSGTTVVCGSVCFVVSCVQLVVSKGKEVVLLETNSFSPMLTTGDTDEDANSGSELLVVVVVSTGAIEVAAVDGSSLIDSVEAGNS